MLSELFLSMGDRFTLGGKGLETLPSILLPCCYPATVRISADPGDTRRVVSRFGTRACLPTTFAQFLQLIVTPACSGL